MCHTRLLAHTPSSSINTLGVLNPVPATNLNDVFSVALQRACRRGVTTVPHRLCWSTRNPDTTVARGLPDHVVSKNAPGTLSVRARLS